MIKVLICFFLFIYGVGFSAYADNNKDFLPKFSVNKYGTLVGIQRGKQSFIELGIEKQKKQIKLSDPNTIAWNSLLEYSWDANALGLKFGSWYKTGRMGLTYGLNALGTSNFTKYNFGIAPQIGFKIIGFHAMASYNLFAIQKNTFNYNTLHISIRYYISRDRDYDIKKAR